MKPLLPLVLVLFQAASLPAAELDLAGLGADLNGWTEWGVAAYGTDGAVFELARPTQVRREGGGIAIRATVREVSRAGAPFEATLQLEASPDGRVQSVTIDGEVDAKPFDAGTATRPEPPTVPEPDAGEGEEGGTSEVAEPAEPFRPVAALRQDSLERLASALGRARSSKRIVKRDVSAWLFGGQASPDDTLVKGVAVALDALLRRTGP